jgi:aryl-alcohol dehydrogenase-like predicted oxidoreductase
MLKRALQDNFFDVIMVSYHLANRSAECDVLPLAMAKDAGVIAMRAARDQVSRSAAERLKLFSRAVLGGFASLPSLDHFKNRLWVLRSSLRQTRPHRELSLAREDPGDYLRLPAAGYTFAVSHPAVATALTGTTDLNHLEQNIAATLAPPLTPREIDGLQALLQ